MSFWLPFKDRSASGEAGNMLIITGLIASAVAVAGGKIMLDRSTAQRSANQMAVSMKQAKEIPGSAAMIAKALISLPPNVAANKSVEWTTSKLVSSPGNMPLIYPIPYVSGVIGSPALPATSVDKTVNPAAGSNWDTYDVTGATSVEGVFASASVNVYTNDSSRAMPQDINTAISGKAVASGNATIKRTKSVVTYSFRNCTLDGVTSTSFTGRYCVTANIESDNYASSKKGNNTVNAQSNKGIAELGLIATPPAPACGTISTPGNAPVKAGDPFSLEVRATGVAIGYAVKLTSPTVSSSDANLANSGTISIRMALDHPRLERMHTITDIPTSNPSVKAALSQAGVSSMTLAVELTPIDGSVTTCNVVVPLDKPIVACETGSFAVSRTGADKRTCSISLRKDNGMGVVKQVRMVQTNTTTAVSSISNLAAIFSGNNWSTTVPCSQDGFTFNASLIREYPVGTPVAASQCSPQQIVAELPPDCDAVSSQNANPGRVAPPPMSNLLKCSVKVVRTPASHTGAGVWIDGVDRTSLGTWASNVWTGVVPCAAGAITMSAALKKDSTSSSCWTKPISATDPALCVSNSTRAYRTAGNNSQCYVTLTKNALSTPYFDIKVNGNIYAGTWTANNWRSVNFACSLDQNSYKATLTGVDGVPSDCGTSILPAIPPVCSSMTASRQSPTSTTCNVTITKGAAGGSVISAKVNGTEFSSVDQASYNTTTSCAAEGATITGSLSNSGGTGSCPTVTIPCNNSFQQCTGTAAECMAQADTGLGITPGTATTAKSTLGSDTVLSFYAANNGQATNSFTVPRLGKMYVLLVGGGGGAGGWQVAAGGAGAGGVKRGLLTICPGTYSVSVGTGGTGRANDFSTHGGDSSIGNLVVAKGGGTTSSTDQGGTVHPGRCPAGGWGPSNKPPVNPTKPAEWMYNYAGTAFCYGGSGGGASPIWGKSWPGGRPYNDPNQEGNNGGLGLEILPLRAGGGGGGAGAAGTNATSAKGGDGGNGIQSDITGTNTWYAGGGGGGHSGLKNGIGGQGGGGNGCSVAGANRTGGGGGGGCCDGCAGGNGGAGIVVIRFK